MRWVKPSSKDGKRRGTYGILRAGEGEEEETREVVCGELAELPGVEVGRGRS